jgi:hypothetical protein
LRADDQEGLKVVTTWLVDSQQISVEEAAAVQGVTVRTVAGYQAIYAETANSADLVDRRHFNGGQQTAYQMELHKPALVRCVTLNLVHGEPNSERRLAEQLGCGVDDRTVGRHLQAMGWRAAEAAGLSAEVAAREAWRPNGSEPIGLAWRASRWRVCARTVAPGSGRPRNEDWWGRPWASLIWPSTARTRVSSAW